MEKYNIEYKLKTIREYLAGQAYNNFPMCPLGRISPVRLFLFFSLVQHMIDKPTVPFGRAVRKALNMTVFMVKFIYLNVFFWGTIYFQHEMRQVGDEICTCKGKAGFRHTRPLYVRRFFLFFLITLQFFLQNVLHLGCAMCMGIWTGQPTFFLTSSFFFGSRLSLSHFLPSCRHIQRCSRF